AGENRRAHLFTVLGEPGIGKTRLADEFLASLPEEVRVLSGTAGRFEEETALAPIAEMLRREIGVERDAPPEVVRKRLEGIVGGGHPRRGHAPPRPARARRGARPRGGGR